MSQAAAPKGHGRTVRGYAFALAGVVVLGVLYFWANTGPHDKAATPARTEPAASPTPTR